MFNIEEMAEDIHRETYAQEMAYPFNKNDYIKLVVNGIRKLYVDINHPEMYDRSLLTTDEDNTLVYDYDFTILQEDYIHTVCLISYKQMYYSEHTGDKAKSYTTDAITVTGAKEGYKSVLEELVNLEAERIRLFHKLMAHEAAT